MTKLIQAIILATLFLSTSLAHAQSLQDVLGGGDGDSSEKKSSSQNRSNNHRIPSNLESHSLGIGIGQTFLKSDFGRNGEDKITWDLYYNYRASHSFDFVANFHLMRHKIDNTSTHTRGLALGIKARVFQFDNFSPYVLGGFGFYQPKMKRIIEEELVNSETKTTFGWHLGGGAELQLNQRFSTGILLHIHNPFSIQQPEGQPDVTGWYYKLLITGMYTF